MEKLTYLLLREIERGALSPQFSHLEQKFPRIVMRMVELWHSGACRNYLHSLLLDERGDRQGFPPEVMDELILLDRIHGSRELPDGSVASTDNVFEFRFNSPKESAPANLAPPSGGWLRRIFHH
jgi:hypothetical protein